MVFVAWLFMAIGAVGAAIGGVIGSMWACGWTGALFGFVGFPGLVVFVLWTQRNKDWVRHWM